MREKLPNALAFSFYCSFNLFFKPATLRRQSWYDSLTRQYHHSNFTLLSFITLNILHRCEWRKKTDLTFFFCVKKIQIIRLVPLFFSFKKSQNLSSFVYIYVDIHIFHFNSRISLSASKCCVFHLFFFSKRWKKNKHLLIFIDLQLTEWQRISTENHLKHKPQNSVLLISL